MLIKKKVSSVFQLVATLATLTVIVALGSTNPAAAEGVSDWDDLVSKTSELAPGQHHLTVTGTLTLSEQSKPLVVPEGVQLTLEGTGTVTGTNATAVEIKSGGKLNLSGPSFTKAQFTVNGDLNFSAGSIYDSAPAGPVIFVDGGNFTMSDTADFSKNTMPEDKVTTKANSKCADLKDIKLAPITVHNGTATVIGGTIKGNRGFFEGGALGVWGSEEKAATLNIKGGEIADNSVQNSRCNGYGGAVFGAYTNVNISGGNIHDNFTERGGALALENGAFKMSSGNLHENQASREYKGNGGALYLDKSETEISGGAVNNNVAKGWGGAIEANEGTITINGGDFSNNQAYRWGGAIDTDGGTITINGGSFTGNNAGESGGAIAFGGKAESTINAAHFSENKSEGFWGGGAIYNDTSAKLTVNNAVIRNNTVKDSYLIGANNRPISKQGGGVWNCPTGHTTLNITRGVAFYGNSAEDTPKYESFNGAGDDFAGITKHFAGEPREGQPVSVSPRMLGGGQRLWYKDGSIYGVHSNWELAKQLPRYKEGGDNKLIPYDTEINENKAFKSVPSEDSKKLAEKIARVVIENNTATKLGISGAGIANNGQLAFGDSEEWKLRVKKSWKGDDPEQRPTKITLDVLVGGFQVDQVELSKENNWMATVENFPNPDTLIDAKTGKKLPITFREHDGKGKQLDGYQLVVTGESADQENKIYSISLENQLATEIEVAKKWSNPHKSCPDVTQIEVQLLANGKDTGKKLTLNPSNSWEGKFTGLPKHLDGKLAEYSVSEVEIKGYRVEIRGDAAGGFLITNKCTVPPSDITPPPESTPPPATTPPSTTPPPPPGDTPPPPKKTPPLPRTGSEISAALALGILAVAAGVMLVRRRLQNA